MAISFSPPHTITPNPSHKISPISPNVSHFSSNHNNNKRITIPKAIKRMSVKSRGSYIVAASIGAVEALKDQGIARWNYPLRRFKNHYLSKLAQSQVSQSAKQSNSDEVIREIKMIRRSKEENFNKVIELNCWGPSTTRF